MKILLACIGKVTFAPFRESIERYSIRIPHYLPFEIKEIPDVKNSKNMSELKQKELEGESILSAITPQDFVVLLDEKGREFTSREFAKYIDGKLLESVSRLIFVVGGPYGFSDKVYARANFKVSLSKMTFPHELVRVFFVEQLYRAVTILKGEPYHHD